MQEIVCGIDTLHELGKFCERKTFNQYGIFQFHTDFYYEKNNELLRGNKNDLLIIFPGDVVYHGPISNDKAFSNDWIYVEDDDFGRLLNELELPSATPFNSYNKKVLNSYIKKISDETTLKYQGWEISVKANLTLMAVELFRIYSKSSNHNSPKSRVFRVRETVLYNLQNNWTLGEMSALCNYSTSQFSSIYTELFGISPKADLLKARLEKAEQMLKYTDFSITEIAEKCGFNSIYYFSKHFKEIKGISPTELRKS